MIYLIKYLICPHPALSHATSSTFRSDHLAWERANACHSIRQFSLGEGCLDGFIRPGSAKKIKICVHIFDAIALI
jgi:hypothetical protein